MARSSAVPEVAAGGERALRVVLADDDVLLREGLASLLERSGFEVVGQAGDAPEPEGPTVSGGAAEPRFGMLDTIREYALERLAESGEEDTRRQQHVDPPSQTLLRVEHPPEHCGGAPAHEATGWQDEQRCQRTLAELRMRSRRHRPNS